MQPPTPSPRDESLLFAASALKWLGLALAGLTALSGVLAATTEGRIHGAGGMWSLFAAAGGLVLLIVAPAVWLRRHVQRRVDSPQPVQLASDGRFIARRRVLPPLWLERGGALVIIAGFLGGGAAGFFVDGVPPLVPAGATAFAVILSWVIWRVTERGLRETVRELTLSAPDDPRPHLTLAFRTGAVLTVARPDLRRVERHVWRSGRGPAAAMQLRLHLAPPPGAPDTTPRPRLVTLIEPWDLPILDLAQVLEAWAGLPPGEAAPEA
jgi:hypothetical protein